jgi:hypothetical protein
MGLLDSILGTSSKPINKFNVKTFDKGIMDSAFSSLKSAEKASSGQIDPVFTSDTGAYRQGLADITKDSISRQSGLIDSAKNTGLDSASMYGGRSASLGSRASEMADRNKQLAGINAGYEQDLLKRSGEVQGGMLAETQQRDFLSKAPSMYAGLASMDQERLNPMNQAEAGRLQAQMVQDAGRRSAYGQLMGMAGTVGGTMIGGPAGGAVGGYFGNQIGQGMAR